jgi:hypothetical protein
LIKKRYNGLMQISFHFQFLNFVIIFIMLHQNLLKFG